MVLADVRRVRTLSPGIDECRLGEENVVIKRQTPDSLGRTLCGYAAAFMAGADDATAQLRVHGTESTDDMPSSDWVGRKLSDGVYLLPASASKTEGRVPNRRRMEFRHKTLDTTCIPDFVRAVTNAGGQVYTITTLGMCGTTLLPKAKVTTRAVETISSAVVRLAACDFFATDLKLGNFIWLNTEGPDHAHVFNARLIDHDQIGTGVSGWRSVSFFNELWWTAAHDPALFDVALSHPDIIAACRQASDTLKGSVPTCTAQLEMHLLMRAILAFLNFQLKTSVEIPHELLVPEDKHITWECYVGGEFFDAYCVV